jgi:hypothetical protein
MGIIKKNIIASNLNKMAEDNKLNNNLPISNLPNLPKNAKYISITR